MFHEKFHTIMLFLILSLVFARSGISKIAKNFVNQYSRPEFFSHKNRVDRLFIGKMTESDNNQLPIFSVFRLRQLKNDKILSVPINFFSVHTR